MEPLQWPPWVKTEYLMEARLWREEETNVDPALLPRNIWQ